MKAIRLPRKKEVEETLDVFRKHELNYKRLISFSKSGYRKVHPDNIVYYNANIAVSGLKRVVWRGDLDVTADCHKIQAVADEIRSVLYILPEMYGTFGGESRWFKELKKDAIAKFIPGAVKYLVREFGKELTSKKIDHVHILSVKKIGWKEVKL